MRRVTSRSRFPRRPSHLASACALRSCSLRVHVTSISVIRHVPIKSLDYHLGEMIRAKGPCLGGQAVLAASAEDQDLLAGVPSWRAVEASRASRSMATHASAGARPATPTSQHERGAAVRSAACAAEPASAKRDSISSSVGSGTPSSAARLSIHSRVEGIFVERTMRLVTS